MAQLANTTALVGNVTDAAGAAIPNASVTAVNSATSDTYATTTNAEGLYRIEFVRIGAYAITVKHEGFSATTVSGVTVETNQTARTDFSLKIGQVTESLQVTAATPPIATDEASIREVLSKETIADLPLNGRDALQLAITTPGVIQGLKAANGVPPGEDFIGAGTREIQNSISLDGISIVNNLITTAPFHPSVDAVQELEVQTGTYSAQYGAYLGVHLNVITKSGANRPHGAVYEFLRNNDLDARNFFLPASQKKAPLRQNQFGVEFDGPVYIPKLYDGRNKTFFTFAYEGLRKIAASTTLDSVLTPLMRQGNFSEVTSKAITDPFNSAAPFPGNIIPTSRLSPQALKFLQYMPVSNLPGTTSNLVATYANPNDNFDQTLVRVDHNLTNTTRLFFRYAYQPENIYTGATNPTSGTTLPVTTTNWVGAWTQTISPTMVNDLRVGKQALSTNALNYFYTGNLTHAGSDIGIPGFDGDVRYADPGIRYVTTTGFQALGNAGTNWFQQDTTWQGADSFTWTKGVHTLIFGAELRKLITGRSAVNDPLGLINFDGTMTGYSAADFMLGVARNDQTPGPEIYNRVAEWRDGFFAVDNWQATKRLTFNLGLRYELPTVPYSVNGFALILNPAQTALIPGTVPQPGLKLTGPDHKDFAPRFGATYRLANDTVIRAGFGIYYNPNQTNSFTFLSVNPPLGSITTYNAAAGVPTLTLAAPTPAGAVGAPPAANSVTIYSPAPFLPAARMNQWSMDVQQGLWKSAALEIGYLGSHSLHLDRSNYDNTPAPGPGSVNPRRPNQLFGRIRIIQNDEIANYHHLSETLRQRLASGLTVLASYTWSHTLVISSDSNRGGAPMNPYNWRGDYGNSNWDIRHRFIASFTYEIPFLKSTSNVFLKQTLAGWQTNGIVTLQGGLPFNVVISSDVVNTGEGSQRPNLLAVPSNNCGDGHLTNCINASAYAVPAAYTFGNEGRNALRGPGLASVNASFFKNFGAWESLRIQFRAEFFNFLNTPNFPNPGATFNPSNLASFGNITSTLNPNRQIQFGLKLLF